ncbi:UNVERIFIED_CONTAM: hypothetical protein K2H54_066663 [Gekko kuhli]
MLESEEDRLQKKCHAGEKPRRRPSDGGQGSSRNAPLHPPQGPSVAEKFGSESGEEDEGPAGSAQEAQPQALLQQAPWLALDSVVCVAFYCWRLTRSRLRQNKELRDTREVQRKVESA